MIQVPIRILLVEDSVDDAELIVRALERSGHAAMITRVETARELRKLLSEPAFDLVITDHELRGFDSTDVLEILAEVAPDVPCLLVSGKVGEEAVGRAMRQGAVDYVAKDRLGNLAPAVARTLREREREREAALAEDALARSGRLFEAVFANARDAILIVDGERRLVDANPAAAELFAMARDDLLALCIEDLVPVAAREDASRRWGKVRDGGGGRGETELLRADDSLVAVEYTVAANFLPNRHIIVIRDIRERREAEAAVARRVVQQEAIVELGERALREKNIDSLMGAVVTRIATTLGVEIVSVFELREGEGTLVRAEIAPGRSRTGTRIGDAPMLNSLAGLTVREEGAVLVEDCAFESRFDRTPDMEEWGVRSALSVEISGGRAPFGVLQAASTTPHAFDLHDASFLTTVGCLLADALERARGEEEIRDMSLQDPLTGLPNRTVLYDRLTLGLARTKRTKMGLAVLFIDIDRFKGFNDSHGHLAADQLLIQVGARIAQAARETDTVARFGGDEFVVVCEDLAEDGYVDAVSQRILSVLETPFWIDGESHTLSASIGVALSGADSAAEDLVRAADIAMYRSKEKGGAAWTMASEELLVGAADRVETKRELEQAIQAGELVLNYQPIVTLAGGEIRAVEALARWKHPRRGLISPASFIPLAEESSLILRLGDWVLRTACRQAARWRAEFGEDAPLPIHINLAARQVGHPGLPELVGEILAETGVAPRDIILEITETALIDGLREPIAVLEALKLMGVGIVLDDFGTGYSSLSYLDRFPIDTLKIDRAFVSQLSSAEPAPIISAILSMAHVLGVGAVAEGVETAEQAAAISAMGCELAQGYFFARPMSAGEITALVHDDSYLRARAAEAGALTPPGQTLLPWGARPVDAQAATPAVAGVNDYRMRFFAALLSVDAHAADEIIHSALADGIAPETIDVQIIGAAMVEIGRFWELGEVTVAQENLATGLASRAAALAARAPGSRAADGLAPRRVLLATAEGDDHVLGLRMVADALQPLGADVRYLGSRVPNAELCDLAAQFQPDIIGLSMTLPELAPALAGQLDALREVCPHACYLLGGQGVTTDLAEKTGATFVRDVEELMAMAQEGAAAADEQPSPVAVG